MFRETLIAGAFFAALAGCSQNDMPPIAAVPNGDPYSAGPESSAAEMSLIAPRSDAVSQPGGETPADDAGIGGEGSPEIPAGEPAGSAAESPTEVPAASPTETPAETPGDDARPGSANNDNSDNLPATRQPADPPPKNEKETPDTDTDKAPAEDQTAGDGKRMPDLGTRKQGADWPTFLGPTADSKSAEKGILKTWPENGPRIVWQRELGTSYGIGAVSRGRYYQFDRLEDPLERGTKAPGLATLFCLNAETGEEIWKFAYPTDYEDIVGYNNGPRCSPVVDGNRVYIFGAEGMLHCLNAEKGTLIWKLNTTEKYGVVQNFFGVGSSPVIEGDLLICLVGGSPPDSPELYSRGGKVEGNGTGIVAFDKFTGREKYRLTDELASYSTIRLTTVGDRRWAFAFCRGGLVGFNPTTGKQDFHYPWRSDLLESVNASVPVLVGNEVFISETYSIGSSLLKFSPGKVETIWKDNPKIRAKAMRCHWNTPIYVDGYLYGCSGRNPPDAELRCIDWKTGEVKWSVRNRERTSLLYVDNHFIVLGEYGSFALIKPNPEEFELVDTAILRDKDTPLGEDPEESSLLQYPCWAAPILSHGLLYVRGTDRLLCLELIPEPATSRP